MKKNIYPLILPASVLALVVLGWAVITLLQRASAEHRNNTVEICLDLEEVSDYCYKNNYSLHTFLGRAQAIGVASAAVEEETLSSFVRSGKILYFGRAEYQRLKLLDLISPGANINGEYLLTADKAIAGQLKRQISMRHHIPVKSLKTGKYQIICPDFSAGALAPYWNESLPLGADPEKVRIIADAGLKVVMRPINVNDAYVCFEDTVPTMISAFMSDGREIPGYPGKEQLFADKLRQYGIKQVPLEFTQVYGTDALGAAAPELIVRGHTITIPEMNNNFSGDFWIARWRRAARERGLRFMYVHIWANKNVEDNFIYLRTLAQSLKADGLYLGVARAPDYPARGASRLWAYLAFMLACAGPVAAFMIGKKFVGRPALQYTAANLVTFASALVVAACLYDVVFMQKVVDVPGVKLAMLLPLAVGIIIAYKPQQIKSALQFQLKVWHLLAALSAIGITALMLARSGNFSAGWMHPDSGFRSMLENLLVIRPRTKELLIGQPLLYLGFAFGSPLLTLIGYIGQISVVNTFMHAHSPLYVSIIRTIYGQVMGIIIGIAAAYVYRRFLKKTQ